MSRIREPAGKTRAVRSAIYTRKSTEEGLEQEFNSLDAQREACAAYIVSQRHEGWRELPGLYDDGGFSGGTLERPALAQLLADIEAGRIDVVVVYKVDRLTRSLADFARIVAIFDTHDVSFVSVTQAFNTTSSMGRLTLNVLLSFAQFEREVTAERIRDKIAASKRKGFWMGGNVPIGYRAENRALVKEQEEAALVRRIFARYLDLGSVPRLKAELDREGIRAPRRRHRSGRSSGGALFSKGKLYALLSNPVYIGRIRHKEDVHPGQHEGIVDEGVWNEVQARLASGARVQSANAMPGNPSALAGKVRDPDGNRMRPSHARKTTGKRYRYYVSEALIENSVGGGATGWRIPASELERMVASAIASRLRTPELVSEVIARADASRAGATSLAESIAALASMLTDANGASFISVLRDTVIAVRIRETELEAEFRLTCLANDDRFHVRAPITMSRRGVALRLILHGAAADRPGPDPNLLRTIVQAQSRALDYIEGEHSASLRAIAERDGIDLGDLSRSLQLAFLAPDLVERILDGTQSTSLTTQSLKRIGDLPLLWNEQRALLG